MKAALVVALNPSVDVEWRVPRVCWEQKNVLEGERRWPGGKGVNVARWLKHLGTRSRLLLPLGGATGAEMESGLRRERIPLRVLPLRAATRANVIVTTARQGQLRFNPPGPLLSRADWGRIKQAIAGELESASLLILSGSLPRGVPVSAYAQLITLARRAGVRALLDCDGAPFCAAVRARPFLVKPNEHELAEFAGRRLVGETALRHAAEALSALTQGWVLVSRGGAGGMLVQAGEDICLQARARRLRPLNTVGAGDAMLAAVAQHIMAGSPPAEWLRRGIAAGTALATCPAGVLPSSQLLTELLGGPCATRR